MNFNSAYDLSYSFLTFLKIMNQTLCKSKFIQNLFLESKKKPYSVPKFLCFLMKLQKLVKIFIHYNFLNAISITGGWDTEFLHTLKIRGC